VVQGSSDNVASILSLDQESFMKIRVPTTIACGSLVSIAVVVMAQCVEVWFDEPPPAAASEVRLHFKTIPAALPAEATNIPTAAPAEAALLIARALTSARDLLRPALACRRRAALRDLGGAWTFQGTAMARRVIYM
jgi:hypothetical protein